MTCVLIMLSISRAFPRTRLQHSALHIFESENQIFSACSGSRMSPSVNTDFSHVQGWTPSACVCIDIGKLLECSPLCPTRTMAPVLRTWTTSSRPNAEAFSDSFFFLHRKGDNFSSFNSNPFPRASVAPDVAAAWISSKQDFCLFVLY